MRSSADITSLLAMKAGKVVGCGTLVRDPHSWSPHVGESEWWCHRMFAAGRRRGCRANFALALGPASKSFVQMTSIKTAIAAVRKPRLQGRGAAAEHVRDVEAGSTTSSCWA